MAVGRTPIIVALDVDSAEEAVRLAKRLHDVVGGFKVGLGLLHGPGPGTVAALADLGKPILADAKLHDIPSQVAVAARRLERWGARWVTAHASGGKDMLEAAAQGFGEGSGDRAGILGVSVLTSLDEAALARVGIAATPGRLVSKMARVVASAGCEGIICSPRELGVVAEVASGLLKVTPGIRPGGSDHGDQVRVANPEWTLAHGADWLVIGRPITAAADPEAAAVAIAKAVQNQN